MADITRKAAELGLYLRAEHLTLYEESQEVLSDDDAVDDAIISYWEASYNGPIYSGSTIPVMADTYGKLIMVRRGRTAQEARLNFQKAAEEQGYQLRTARG